MRMAKVSNKCHAKRGRGHTSVALEVHKQEIIHQDDDDDEEHDDFRMDDEDVVGPASFSLEDPGELCLDKVVGVDGLLGSIQPVIPDKIPPISNESFELTTRSGRRISPPKKTPVILPPELKSEFAPHQQPSLTFTVGAKDRGAPPKKVPKVTLKLGGSPSPSSENSGNKSSISISTTTSSMKSKSSARQSLGAAGQAGAVGSTVVAVNNGGGGGKESSVDQEISSGGPRTPGTPSDLGSATPNPPTPGNTSSSGMVNSPHQYVTITVDGESGVVTDGGVGATPSAYPVYNVGDAGAIYASGSGQYYSNSSGPPYGQDGGVYMVPTNGGVNGIVGSECDGPHNLSHATRVSPTTSPPCRKRSLSTNLHEIERPDLAQLDGGTSENSEDEDEYDNMDQRAVDCQFNNDGGDGLLASLGLTDMEMSTFSKMTKSNSLISSNGTFKPCPLAVQWLLDNYETAEGVSLPRSTLYSHYLRHCSDDKLDPVNAASFGKLIRSVFVGLRTRRLGTRGNSKYHYYGIRIKPSSMLNHLPEEFHFPSAIGHGRINSGGGGGRGENGGSSSGGFGSNKRLKTGKSESYDGSHSNGFAISDSVTVQQYLGDPTGQLDDFPELDLDAAVPEGLEDNDLHIFGSLYKEHCESLMETLASFQLGQIEGIWKFFWRTGGDTESSLDFEKILPKEKLILMCQMKAVQEFVKEVDWMLYQKLVGILLPDVLRPIPSTMTQAIRNFAKTLENWMTAAMLGFPEEMVVIKISIVSALAQTLRRYTSLNHLAQAARAVLQNQTQITQMLSDLNRVDFHTVTEQASWVCDCSGEIVPALEQDFKSTLSQQQTLEQWAAWLEGVVDRVLRPHLNTPKYVQTARHFLLKWSFYSSLVIRDLTLRSAASFGSFHLLRLLYDEYMFYLVEHRVAQVSGIVPIAVIGKKSSDKSAIYPSNGDSPESQTMLNGHSKATNLTNSSTSNSSGDGETQDMIINNNTPVKSEFNRRTKHFLTS
ncbi:transcription factor RFX3 isoform X4 [Folsomia candida]|uniref:transcription factor RFX3 isoform X4 n=1 Tax=Folsomia candida TaxID=158441 RepID=UPI001604A8EC|nr:transcription factor RFX3 isoform X4 [Folsomia candida]